MGITIDADMYLICSMFNVSYKKIANEYSGMSVEEIMQAEAKQGNTAAAQFDAEVLSNPVKLIELFQLKDPGNKFSILQNMNENDMQDLLPLLQQKDLVVGLNYFSKDKLLDMMKDLPMEQLVKMTFQMFSPEQVMQFLPEEQLNKALQSTDMDKNLEIKYLQTMKPEVMAQMLEAATGQPVPTSQNSGLDAQAGYDKQALFSQIASLPDDKFKEAMLGIPTQNKRSFLLKMSQEEPKIFQMFDAEAYTKMVGQRKQKEDMVKSAIVLEQDSLVKMISQLPKDLTAAVLTQIDTGKFADVLQSQFKDILKQIVAC